ncbi:hypothetical protein HispidOSU_012816, partial [Sigmodon hispidus]
EMKPELAHLQKGRVTSLRKTEEKDESSMVCNPKTNQASFTDTFCDSTTSSTLT